MINNYLETVLFNISSNNSKNWCDSQKELWEHIINICPPVINPELESEQIEKLAKEFFDTQITPVVYRFSNHSEFFFNIESNNLCFTVALMKRITETMLRSGAFFTHQFLIITVNLSSGLKLIFSILAPAKLQGFFILNFLKTEQAEFTYAWIHQISA